MPNKLTMAEARIIALLAPKEADKLRDAERERERRIAGAEEALDVPTGSASRDAYQAGYRTQRQGSFFRPNPHLESVELAVAWDQGYKHAEYNERHGLQHLHLPNTQSQERRAPDSAGEGGTLSRRSL